MQKHTIEMNEIRALASKHPAERLAGCLAAQLERGANACYSGGDNEQDISVLARAAFVRTLSEEQGMSMRQALRELGARMRRLAG